MEREFVGGLVIALKDLEAALGQAVVRSPEFFFQVSLLGLARHVYDAAMSHAALAPLRMGGGEPAIARSTLEAAVEVLFLASRQSRKQYWGARVYVAELIEDEEVSRMLSHLGEAVEPSSAAVRMEEAAAFWEELEPGSRSVLAAAMSDVVADRQSRRYHWSGKSRDGMVTELERVGGLDQDTVKTIRTWYKILSVVSHPTPRFDRRYVSFEAGAIRVHLNRDTSEDFGAFGLVATTTSVLAVREAVRAHLGRGTEADGGSVT